MDDLISRKAAIDALGYAQHRFTVADEAGGMGTVKWSEDVIYFAAAERILTELPSAQRTGRWIKADTHNYLFFKNDRIYKCSNCGHLLDFEGVNGGRGDANFCPNCGCAMKGEDE